MKLEAQFSAEIRNDLKDVYKSRIHVELVPNMMRTGKKPYDFYFNFNDHFCGVECKRVKGHTFNVKQLEPHQLQCLKDIRLSGGSGLFLVNFIVHKTSFAFSPETFELMKCKYGESFKIDKFLEEKNVIKLTRIKDLKLERKLKTRWEVENLIYASSSL